MNSFIDLKALNIDELAGVVNLYPWFGAARKELCLRISKLGGKGWGEGEYAGNALYVASRKIISDIVRSGRPGDYADKDLHALLKAYTAGEEVTPPEEPKARQRKVRTAGGDFFTQDEYDTVRQEDDYVFSSFASKAVKERDGEKGGKSVFDSFCTETLARVYVEQGYYQEAKFIYSKLILRYPEKSTYFADLIEKLTQLSEN